MASLEEGKVFVANDLLIAAKDLKSVATLPFLPRIMQAFFDKGGTLLAGKISEWAKNGIDRTDGKVIPLYNDWQTIASKAAEIISSSTKQ